MSWAGRRFVHRRQVPFLPGLLGAFPQAGTGSGGRGEGRAARAVMARNAWASIDKVTWRYQARYLRTW